MRHSFLASLALLLMLTVSAHGQVVYDGVILARTNRWDSYPTHIYDGTYHTIWWCSRSTVDGSLGQYTDGIYRARKAGSLGPGGWSSPLEVLTNRQTPWAHNHVCDPSVLRGTFTYGGLTYSHLLFWTSDTNPTVPGVDNAVGVAFSSDGVSWVVHPMPVIQSSNPYNSTYGAGAGGAAFNPVTGRIAYAYDDTTLHPPSRLKETSDGLSFAPSPPFATKISVSGRTLANSSDIAYNPLDQHWYAAVQTFDIQNPYSDEIRVLRSTSANDLTGSWVTVAAINSTITGKTGDNNPGLGRLSNGNLYVDSQGWAYVFFGVGPSTDPWQWDVGQARFRPAGAPSSITIGVNGAQPGYVVTAAVGDPATAVVSPASAVVSIPGGTMANADNLWNVMNDYKGKLGFHAFVDAGATENAALLTVEVRWLLNGISYDVYGRFGAAALQSPPNYFGAEMGLVPSALTRYDQTTTPFTLINDWSNWQEREVLLGTATVSGGVLRIFIEETSLSGAAVWTGFRLVRR